ncbi:MAG: hypothetical protein ACHQ6U_13265 [Thermodesulfobacteriota bacterium]
MGEQHIRSNLQYLTPGGTPRDIEIDRREFNGRTLVLLEDRGKGMMLPDGTSKQYILAVELTSKSGKTTLDHKRYISRLMMKRGYANAREGAKAIFYNPEDFKSIVGEHWVIFSSASSQGPRKRKSLKSV